MKIDKTWMIGLGLTLPLLGCPGDDTNVTGNDSTTGPGNTDTTAGPGTTIDPETTAGSTVTDTAAETAESTDTGPLACTGTSMDGAAEGDACTANSDCASGVCTIFTDVPVNDDAACAPTPDGCTTRITGTIFDFETGEALAGADVLVAAALQAATNPTMAMALVEATSDAEGRIDATSAEVITAPLGIVALTSAGGYFLTATGLAAPDAMGDYNVANSIHDVWAVPEEVLQNWSDELLMDAEIPMESLPLGEFGGVAGLVRDATGQPVAGAEVVSANDASADAIIRYLNDDGTFGVDRTSDSGIFVVIAPGLGGQFTANVDGTAVGGTGTAGSAAGAIFTLIFNGE
jgi:hypothetical protein